ncbi:MAG: hypothetical protein VST67_03570, partial [Nitrospirota bacterium]|nr:hypothetical protein [Nitrospirota bacterium]
SDGKTEATRVKMCHACGSGQPRADPDGYVEEAGGTRACGSRGQCSTPDVFRRCSRESMHSPG